MYWTEIVLNIWLVVIFKCFLEAKTLFNWLLFVVFWALKPFRKITFYNFEKSKPDQNIPLFIVFNALKRAQVWCSIAAVAQLPSPGLQLFWSNLRYIIIFYVSLKRYVYLHCIRSDATLSKMFENVYEIFLPFVKVTKWWYLRAAFPF